MNDLILKYRLYTILFIVVLTGCTRHDKKRLSAPLPLQNEKDSIVVWLDRARTDTITTSRRKHFLTLAYDRTISQSDSVKKAYLYKIAHQASRSGDSVFLKKVNGAAFQLAHKTRDTFRIADTHWNYGAFYLEQERYDSAYYHYNRAQHFFNLLPHPHYSAKMLYNMAVIQSRIKDYTACEVLLFQAITLLEPLKKHKQLYYCYNLLGIVHEELNEPQEALTYYKKALEYLKPLPDKAIYTVHTQNNIGVLHQKQGKQKEALDYFNRALKTPNLKSTDIKLYTRLTENRAFSRFLDNDTTRLPRDFYRTIHVWDSIGNTSGVVLGKLRLARFYGKHQDTLKAISLAGDAVRLARNIQNNRDVLAALLLLSELDRKKGQDYLQQYIRLNNDIQERERRTRDKFARIQYETDQYIEKTRQLSSQRVWILTIGIALILLLSLLYIINRQYARNRLLYMETLQQKSNEQIYLLSLKQQAKLEEGRNQERMRISEELHDSILSDLFALRIGWGFLEFEGNAKVLKKHRHYLKELQRIEKEIRDASHELRENLVSFPINFVNIVEKLVINRGKTGGFEYKLTHDDAIPWEDINEQVKVNLYRVIEEALQNCIKHAGAGLVELRFELAENNRLRLIIRDNGLGFNPRKRHKGIGIMNMQSRVQKIKGVFFMDSERNRGTTITITVPL